MNGGPSDTTEDVDTPEPEDPLESSNYDPTAHINALFPDIESLALLPRIDSKLQRYEIELQRSLREIREAAKTSRQNSDVRIAQVEAEMKSLLLEVAEIQSKAQKAENMVSTMTANIRVLDTAKKNITATMTVIKRLQMLTTAFAQLQRLAVGKKYAETASLLSAVIQLMTHFRGYRSIPQIATLSQNVADLQRSFLEKISSEFETFFSEGLSPASRKILSEACTLIDVLGEGAKDRIITWYTNSQLREYRSIFRSSEEAASLDNISRRFAWLKRIYKSYTEDHSTIFPEAWQIPAQLIKSSCDSTREDLATVLSRSPPEIKVLLQALQETLDFERYLSEKVTDNSRTPRPSVDSIRSVQSDGSATEKASKVHKISEVFEPYLGIFVEVQDRTLAAMMAGYRTAPWPGLDEQVLPSSADLFYFYLTTITQCAQLSTGQPLWEFARVMAKYLNQYTEQVLAAKYQAGVVTVEEIIMVLKTCDYCSTTTQQLEERMKAVIQPQLADKITYEFQNNQFLSLMNRSLTLLVSHLERVVDLGLKEMTNIQWSAVTEVGDQSQYVSMLVAGLLREGKRVLQNLGKERFIRNFCDRIVENFVTQYLSYVGKCRPVGEIGAEQMLLDVHSIKVALLNLPGSDTPATYTKLVNKQLGRIETILKLLLTSASPPEGLVQNYLFMIGDKSTANFAKILEIKGIPKPQQAPLMNLFVSSIADHEGPDLVDKNTSLAALTFGDTKSNGDDRRIDPSSFFRDSLGLGMGMGMGMGGGGSSSGSAPVTRQNTGGPQERFIGSQFGKLFSKRTVSGARTASGSQTPQG